MESDDYTLGCREGGYAWYDRELMSCLDSTASPLCLRLHLGVLALVLAVTGCGGGTTVDSESVPAAEPVAEAPPTPTPAESTHGEINGTTQAASGVVVSVVLLDPHGELEIPLPEEPPVMDQYGRQFVPGFILARKGQTLRFTNSEEDLHTVHVKNTAGESLFNIATMMDSVYDYTFDEDDAYTVVCNTHTEMFADILIVDTPYAVVADRDGGFTLSDVVPGSYTATVIHGHERREYEIDITPGLNEISLIE